MSTRPLVLLAHGSRRPGPSSVLSRTAERVAAILPGVEVRTGYVELQSPDPATALEGLVEPVVLPFFLARGYHVVHDVPAALERHGSGTVTGHLGVEEHLVRRPRFWAGLQDSTTSSWARPGRARRRHWRRLRPSLACSRRAWGAR